MSPRRFLRGLLWPDEAFDGWTPGTRAVLLVVVSLCALNAAAVAHAGDAITDEVGGTVTVDNPERPPDWICDDSDMAIGDSGSCNASETIEEPLQPAASGAVGQVTLQAALAPLAWVLLLASAFAVASGRAGGRDGDVVAAFEDGLGVAALAAVPGTIRYVARPVLVEDALADWTHPGTLDGVRSAAVHALVPDGTSWLAIVAFSGAWTAFVVYGGARSVFGVERPLGTLLAGAAFLSVATSSVLANGGITEAPGGAGILVVGIGVLGLLGAYTFISISKAFELIGFSGSRNVDPKPWYVGLHRLAALCVVAVGFAILDGHALA